jgi:CBS domain-containing protein
MTIAAMLKSRSGEVVRVERGDPVSSVVALLAERRIGCVPVVDDGQVVGIFSERDVIYGLASKGAAMLDLPVGEVMTSPAVTIDPETPVLTALSMMTRRRIRHLPVVTGRDMVGFISIGDLVKYRIDLIEKEAEAMRAYIQNA